MMLDEGQALQCCSIEEVFIFQMLSLNAYLEFVLCAWKQIDEELLNSEHVFESLTTMSLN